MFSRSGREHAEELTIRLERLGRVKGDLQGTDVFEILGKRGVVIGIVPVPRWDTLVVVLQDPAEAFYVRSRNSDISAKPLVRVTCSLMKAVSEVGTPNFCS